MKAAFMRPSVSLMAVLCLTLANSCSVSPQKLSSLQRISVCTSGASLINPEAAPGIGGTGQSANAPGIGGTGQIALRPGIGGTGSAATPANAADRNIGLVGVVTGFASICVNDVEVHYTPSTPVLEDGNTGRTSDLAVGQLVAIRASGTLEDSNDPIQAQQIAVLHAAIGPLTRLDKVTGEFEVMGQRATALVKNDLNRLHVGDWVRVSGHRLADGSIRANQVERVTSPSPRALVLGPVTSIHGTTVHVGTTAVQFDSLPDGLELRREIAVRGRWASDHILVSKSTLQPTRAELGRTNTLVLQGYVHAAHGNELSLGYDSMIVSGQVRVHGGTLESLTVNQEVQVRGHIDENQRMVVEQITIGSDNGGRGQSTMNQHGRSGSLHGTTHGSGRTSGNSGAAGGGNGGGSGGGR